MNDIDKQEAVYISDSMDKTMDDIKSLKKQCYIEGDFIILSAEENLDAKYEIPLAHCNTHEKILYWICQLSEKNWIRKDVILSFIFLAAKTNKLTIAELKF